VSSLDLTAAGIIRYFSIALWATLYLTYTSIFGVRLQSWDYNNPGHCYNTHKISTSNAKHPYVDNIYIAITCLYVFVTLINAAAKLSPLSLLESRRRMAATKGSLIELFPRERPLKGRSLREQSLKEHRNSVVTQYLVLNIAFVQFPLHAYSIFTLRRSNESQLNSGNDEQTWGFSQVGAMVLLAPNLIGIVIAVNSECYFLIISAKYM
jgi:hypothetical protein